MPRSQPGNLRIKILGSILHFFADSFSISAISLFLLDEKKRVLTRIISVDPRGEPTPGSAPAVFPLKEIEPFLKRTIREHQAQVLKEGAGGRKGFPAGLYLPLLCVRDLRGLLFIRIGRSDHPVPKERIAIFKSLSGLIALVLFSDTSHADAHHVLREFEIQAGKRARDLEEINEQLIQKNVNLYAVYEINKLMTEAKDPDELFSIILSHALRITKGGNGALVLKPSIDQVSDVKVRINIETSEIEALRRHRKGKLLMAALYKTGQPYLDNHYIGGAMSSVVAVPFVYGGKTVGSLFIHSPQMGAFTQEHVDFLMALAGQAVGIFKERNLILTLASAQSEKNRRLREVLALGEMSRLFLDPGLDEAAMLQSVVNVVRKGLDFDRVGIYLVSEDRQRLESKAGIDERGGLEPPGEMSFPMTQGHTVIADVALGKRPYYYTRDAGRDESLHRNNPRMLSSPAYKDNVIVPLKSANGILGVLCVDNLITGRPIPEEWVADLLTFASQLALAVENHHLERKREELFHAKSDKIRELTVLHEVIRRLGAPLSVSEVLRELYDGVRNGLEFERAGIFLVDGAKEIIAGALGTDDDGRRTDLSDVRIGLKGIEGNFGRLYRGEIEFIFDPEYPLRDDRYDQTRHKREVVEKAVVPMKTKNRVVGFLAVDNLFTKKPIQRDVVATLLSLASHAAQAIDNARLYSDLKKAYLEVVRALATAVEAKDHYTMGHSDKVAGIAVSIAREMGLSPEQVEEIQYGAILHDVGKIGVSEAILNKPDRLTDAEYMQMKDHTRMGINIMRPLETIANIMPIVKYHHEWYNGGGYPEGLQGENIPLPARIVAVADAFDTMVSDRPYRKTPGIPQAVDELKRCSGTQFDPKVVEALLRLLQRHENLYEHSQFMMEAAFNQ